jgi:hypothetical protein
MKPKPYNIIRVFWQHPPGWVVKCARRRFPLVRPMGHTTTGKVVLHHTSSPSLLNYQHKDKQRPCTKPGLLDTRSCGLSIGQISKDQTPTPILPEWVMIQNNTRLSYPLSSRRLLGISTQTLPNMVRPTNLRKRILAVPSNIQISGPAIRYSTAIVTILLQFLDRSVLKGYAAYDLGLGHQITLRPLAFHIQTAP